MGTRTVSNPFTCGGGVRLSLTTFKRGRGSLGFRSHRDVTPVVTQLLNGFKREGQRMQRHHHSKLRHRSGLEDGLKTRKNGGVSAHLLQKLSAHHFFGELEVLRRDMVYVESAASQELHRLQRIRRSDTDQAEKIIINRFKPN